MKYLIGLAFLLLGATCINLVLQNRKQHVFQKEMQKSMESLQTENLVVELHKINREFEISFNGNKIPENAEIYNAENKLIPLRDIVREDLLVFHYSELHCNTCVDAQVENLNALAQEAGIRPLVILVYSLNNAYVNQFKRINKIKFPVYRISDSLKNKLPEIDAPYYFILQKENFRVNSVFVPQKEFPKQAEKYLEHVCNTWFANE